MKEIGFPLLEEHTKLHDDLLKALIATLNNIFASKKSVEDFQNFVYEWITDHILNHDKKYFDYSKSKHLNNSDSGQFI